MPLPSSVTTRLQYQHKSLIEIIDGLSDEQIRKPIIIGKWSIFENIVHLETYQYTFINRIKQILEGSHPDFTRYLAEADPLFNEHCGKSSREIIHGLLTTRKEMSAGVLTFPDSDLGKKGTHPVYGPMDLLQWLNFFLLHEAHHLFTIFKLAAESRRP